MITEVGEIARVSASSAGLELEVRCTFGDAEPGESIAVNGACLTVRESGTGWFIVAAVAPTLERTCIADWEVGTRVNLERALRATDRLGGHFVQGHVDGVARVEWVRRDGDATLVDLTISETIDAGVVLHGSIALDGVSLTVNALPAPGRLQVSLVDYTLRHTTLSAWRSGARVHVEADMIGKYVQRLAAREGRDAWRA